MSQSTNDVSFKSLVLERRLLPPATLSAILAPEALTQPYHLAAQR
jgi:hypothetical protein